MNRLSFHLADDGDLDIGTLGQGVDAVSDGGVVASVHEPDFAVVDNGTLAPASSTRTYVTQVENIAC